MIEFREGVIWEAFGKEIILFDPEEMDSIPRYGVVVRIYNTLEKDINGYISRRIGSISKKQFDDIKERQRKGLTIFGNITIHPLGGVPEE